MRLLLIVVIAVGLTGCKPLTSSPDDVELLESRDIGDKDYHLIIPFTSYFLNIEDGSVAATKNLHEEFGPEDWRIEIDESLAKCPTLGISQPIVDIQTDNELLIWGRADFHDEPLAKLYTEEIDAPCEPPQVWDKLIDGSFPKQPPEGMVAYALCAQKKEKIVLACLKQITNNPALAKQIFETFRWTDE